MWFGPPRNKAPAMTIRNLEHAFRARSVAIIGASPRDGSVGRMVTSNIREAGFSGPIWPVNPKHQEVDGLPCYPNVAALPGVPELAVIATPAQTVPGLITELGDRGTRAAVVLTAGLSRENGLRQAMLDAAKPHTLRIIGPNCLGLFVPGIGLNASFAHIAPREGNLAFLSQSGALASAVLAWADVDVADLLDMLAGDRDTRAILLYLETVTETRKFLTAARAAARIKPVIVIKSGRHAAAAKAAAEDPANGRILTEQLALTAAAAALKQIVPQGICDAFIESRLAGQWRATYGMLSPRHNARALVDWLYPEG